MLRISAAQLAALDREMALRTRARHLAELHLRHGETLARLPDGALEAQIAELGAVGFASPVDLFAALDRLLTLAVDDGKGAEERRALAAAILGNETAPPAARLSFVDAQCFLPEPEASDAPSRSG